MSAERRATGPEQPARHWLGRVWDEAIRCRAADAETARAFAAACRQATRRNLLLGIPVLALCIVAFWPTDLLLREAAFARSLGVLRLAGLLALAGLFGALRSTRLRAYPDAAFALLVVFTAIGFSFAPGSTLAEPWIDTLYLVPFATVLRLGGLRQRVALLGALVGGVVGPYFAVQPEQLRAPQFWPFAVNLLIAALAALALGHFLHYLWWRYYLAQAELARANDGLQAEVGRQTGEIQSLNERLLRLRDQERDRLAGRLGADTGALVSAMAADAERLGALAESSSEGAQARLSELLEELTRGLDRVLRDLRPPALDAVGLVGALALLVESVRSTTTATLTSELDPAVGELAPEVASALYRIAQEALTNAVRHARAARIELGLRREREAVVLSVRDDGVGLAGASERVGTGFGLWSMQERARHLGAAWSLEDDGGTTVRVTLSG